MYDDMIQRFVGPSSSKVCPQLIDERPGFPVVPFRLDCSFFFGLPLFLELDNRYKNEKLDGYNQDNINRFHSRSSIISVFNVVIWRVSMQ
jgi:hypothetical protein